MRSYEFPGRNCEPLSQITLHHAANKRHTREFWERSLPFQSLRLAACKSYEHSLEDVVYIYPVIVRWRVLPFYYGAPDPSWHSIIHWCGDSGESGIAELWL